MPDDRTTISSSRLAPAEVARHKFTTVRRGFDPVEVHDYLELLARELEATDERLEELRQLVAAAEERAQHPVIDEASLSQALGQQSAQVIRNAHEEAARIVGEAEERAAVIAREAQQQAADVQVHAEQAAAARVAEAELAAGAVQGEAQEEAAAIIASARADSETLLLRAREQGRSVLEKAQQSRKQVLTDMAQRRRVLGLQIEQFRAARDELAATVAGVRDAVDTVIANLAHSDDEARAAAADVARRQAEEPAPDGQDHEADDEIGDEGELAAGGAGDPSGAAGASSAPDPRADPVEPDGPIPDSRSVDELFARIRAHHDEPGAPGVPAGPSGAPEAAEAAAAPGAGDPPGPDGGAGAPVVVADLDAAVETGHRTPAEGVRILGPVGGPGTPAATAAPAEGAAAPAAGGATDGDDGPDAVMFKVRAMALDPIVLVLGRRLKRALQDDQNRLLDRIRTGSGTWHDDLLLDEGRQRAVYLEAAEEPLRQAFVAGTAFVREIAPEVATGPAPDAASVDPLAAELADAIVAPLRRRLSTDGGDTSDAADRVGAAYREWRGDRVERLVGDHALSAFSAGVLAGAATGPTGLRWVLSGGDRACPDCDDNSLAGMVRCGEPFPTGHRHPPAHAGCRCLVAPTAT
jgi:DivIVA domain-containing protein